MASTLLWDEFSHVQRVAMINERYFKTRAPKLRRWELAYRLGLAALTGAAIFYLRFLLGDKATAWMDAANVLIPALAGVLPAWGEEARTARTLIIAWGTVVSEFRGYEQRIRLGLDKEPELRAVLESLSRQVERLHPLDPDIPNAADMAAAKAHVDAILQPAERKAA